MKEQTDAATLAGWAVERWAEIRSKMKPRKDEFRHIMDWPAQVYAVSPPCDRLIIAAAERLNTSNVQTDPRLIEAPDTGRIWIVEPDYRTPFWKPQQTQWNDVIATTDASSDPDVGGLEVAMAAFGIWPAVMVDDGIPDAQGILSEVFVEWRSKANPSARIFRSQPVFFGTPGQIMNVHKSDTLGRITAWILAANAFVRQRLINLTPTRPGRGARKRLIREHPNLADGLVNLVLLRATDRLDADRAEAGGVEWNCRWLVNGHWRNQFLPSTWTHVPTWISPYVKGPADKPFVARERRIAVVH